MIRWCNLGNRTVDSAHYSTKTEEQRNTVITFTIPHTHDQNGNFLLIIKYYKNSCLLKTDILGDMLYTQAKAYVIDNLPAVMENFKKILDEVV